MAAPHYVIDTLDGKGVACRSCSARTAAEGPFVVSADWAMCRRCLGEYAKAVELLVDDVVQAKYEQLATRLASTETSLTESGATIEQLTRDLAEAIASTTAAEMRATEAENELASRGTVLEHVQGYLDEPAPAGGWRGA